MMNIPYSFLPQKLLRKISKYLLVLTKPLEGIFPYLGITLRQARFKVGSAEYLAMCLFSDIFLFTFFLVFSNIIISSLDFASPFKISFFISFFLLIFIGLQQLAYPKVMIAKRIRNLERNLLPAMQNALVQLKAGVPLFHIMAQISIGGYGEVSNEFLKVVRDVNAGKPQIHALDMIAFENPSPYFRRVIWQLSNRIKTGADLAETVKEITINLSREQIGQIEKYGAQLSPLSMFYMVIAIIMPSLGLTLLIVMASFMSLSAIGIKTMFWSLYGVTLFVQVMFLGIIKAKRPNLLID
ncbi:type II secretion system F family protein [Candidatus Woesearchaeota archaeon]|nr:type II secretion system F family protein [Candidatus Woesearchaeota archaeon]